MSNKTNKTKKNSVVIEWPSTHFTIDDVQKKYVDASGNPLIINITLRFRVNKALYNKEIVVIGKIKPAIGRPKLVFAKANPSKELLESAKAANVLPIEDKSPTKSSVPVAELKTDKRTKTVVPATAPVNAPSSVVPSTAPKS